MNQIQLTPNYTAVLIFIGFGLFLLCITYFLYYKQQLTFLRKAKSTEAVALEASYSSFSNKIIDKLGNELKDVDTTDLVLGPNFIFYSKKIAVFDFTTDRGKKYRYAKYFFHQYKTGDRVKILYYFSTPSLSTRIVVDPSWIRLWGPSIGFLLFSLFWFLIAVGDLF